MKFLLSAVYGFIGVIALVLPCQAYSSGVYIGDFYYKLDEASKEAVLASCSTDSKDVVVPGSVEYAGETYAVKAIGTQAFMFSDVTTVHIEPGVTLIGECAFEKCQNLKEIVIPGSVKEIKNSAFFECYGLKKITIEDSEFPLILGYDDRSHWNSRYGIFYSTKVIDYIYIGRNLKFVQDDITGYDILPFNGFIEYKSGMTIVLGGGMKKVNSNLFRCCSNILSVEIGPSVEYLESNAFSVSTNLLKIKSSSTPLTVAEKNYFSHYKLQYLELERDIVTADGTGNAFFSDITTLESVAFKGVMTKICSRMFSGCTSISDVRIPGNIEVIEDEAFAGCSGIKYVYFEEGSEAVVVGRSGGSYYSQKGLFEDSPLERIWVYRDIVNAEDCFASPFQGTPVYTALFGEKVTEIPFGCFRKCNNIYAVGFLGNKIKKIGAQAFAECNEITDRIDEDLDIFYGEFSLPESVEEIGSEAFLNSKFKYIRVPSKVEVIEWATFLGCKDLRNVALPDNLERIRGAAFSDCSLGSLTIPDKVSVIEAGAFSDSKINTIILGHGLVELDNPFTRCHLNFIISKAENPPLFSDSSSEPFSAEDYKRIKVTVPDNSISKYQEARIWENFMQYSVSSAPDVILVSKIELSDSEISISLNETVKLSVAISPETVTDKTVEWTTSDSSVATVDAEGNVIAVSVGEATITATCGDKSATCKVTVSPVLAESIALDKTELSLVIGTTAKLTATVLPNDVTDKTIVWTTSGASVATVDAEGNVAAVSVGEATITAACGDKSVTCKVTVSPVLAESIALDKTELSLVIGTTAKLTATVLPNDVTDKIIVWTTSDASVATVDAEGNVTAVSVGEAIVTAACGDKSATCKVTVSPVLAESIALDKTELSLVIGATAKLTATVLPDDVTDKTIVWTTSDASVATVDAEGNVTAVSVGEATITATCGDKSATCKVTVNPVLAESIAIDKTELLLTIGMTAKLTATVLPDDVTDKTIVWTTSGASVATVDAEGNVAAVSVGEATITAACGDKSVTCKVTVNPVLAESIALDKTELSLVIGATAKLTATVLPDGVTDKTIEWTTSDSSVSTVDSEGNVTAVSLGEAIVTATCGDKSATCEVTVNPVLAESIALDKTELSLVIGATAKLTATVLPDDVTDKTIVWTTSDASAATVDAEGNVTAVSVGEATITAACGDKSATCKVTVSPVLAESIALDKTELLLTIGTTAKLTATVLPDDVTDKTIVWTTSDSSVATVDAEGNVTAVSVGEATITATCGDKSATSKVTVSPVLAESIALDKTELSLVIGSTAKLTATVLPDDVTDKTIVWTTSDASVSTVDAEGNVTAVSVGEAIITATCGDKSATCKVTVNPVLAESIALDKTELVLTIGTTAKLTATVLPDDVTDKTIVWTTSDASVSTVDAEGNVTAVSVGEAIITATCGDKSATCKVTVNPVLAESIALDKTELSLVIGTTAKLTATVLPDDVTDKTIVWATSDASVATVDAEGNVTAVGVGKAMIKAACSEVYVNCEVAVTQFTTGIAVVESDDICIIVEGSELRVVGVESTDNVTIIRQDGAIIYLGANCESYSLVRGLYIVVVNNTTFKVVIN